MATVPVSVNDNDVWGDGQPWVGRSGASVVNVRRGGFDVYVGRENPRLGPGHRLANPFKITASTRRDVVLAQYRRWLAARFTNPAALGDLHGLDGKTLGCWCHPQACHADVIVEWLDRTVPVTEILSRWVTGDASLDWNREFALLSEVHASQLATLASNLAVAGFQRPLLVDLTGPAARLVDGHHRLLVAVRRGWPRVPVDIWDPAGA